MVILFALTLMSCVSGTIYSFLFVGIGDTSADLLLALPSALVYATL